MRKGWPPELTGLPSAVKVGGHTIRFSLVDPQRKPFMRGLNGLLDFDAGRIYLSKEFFAQKPAKTRVAELVQHEVTHAINFVFGIDDDSTEEKFTTQHTTGLVAVLRDNPAYREWLFNTIASDEAPDHP